MKIKVLNKNPKKILFSELKFGEVFEFADAYYMKITYDYGDSQCVDLVNGVYYNFEDTTEVTPVDCALTIN